MLIVYTYTQGQNQAHVLIIKPTFFSNGGHYFQRKGGGRDWKYWGPTEDVCDKS